MKKAEEWILMFDLVSGGIMDARAVRIVRWIQADALRYAANMSGDLKNVALLKEADELDPDSESHAI